MWYSRFLSKRLAVAITGVVTAVQAGNDPMTTTIAVAAIVCAYIAAETTRPSGSDVRNSVS
jgi:hypothetical protein